MADISKITMPSGTTYDIKDAVAREAIAGGVSFIVAWDGQSVPVPAGIPEGIKVVYQGTTYTGTLSPETSGSGTHAQAGAFYLVYASTETKNWYDEYVPVGIDGSKTWEKIGSATVDLSGVVTDVTTTGHIVSVLNSNTTLKASASNVSFGTPTTDKALGEDTTFTVIQPTIAVTPATDTIVGTNGTVSIPNVTGNTNVTATKINSYGTASTWSYTVTNETLTISGANSTIPSGTDVQSSKVTLGTAISAAKVGSEKTFMTGASATASGAAVSANKTSDPVNAVTAMPIATAAAQDISFNSVQTTDVLAGINVVKHD